MNNLINLPSVGQREYTNEEFTTLVKASELQKYNLVLNLTDEQQDAFYKLKEAVFNKQAPVICMIYTVSVMCFGVIVAENILDLVGASIPFDDFEFMHKSISQHIDYFAHPETLDFLSGKMDN